MKSLIRLAKLADKFETKYAQTMESPDAFDTWLNAVFNQSDKNKILNDINQAVEGLDTFKSVFSVKNKTLSTDGIVDGKSNPVASKILYNAVMAKKPDLAKFDNQSTNWIKYPAK